MLLVSPNIQRAAPKCKHESKPTVYVLQLHCQQWHCQQNVKNLAMVMTMVTLYRQTKGHR
jgi:hypothetical protein